MRCYLFFVIVHRYYAQIYCSNYAYCFFAGANKGQGFALCQRILTEQLDTHVFLCSRDVRRGEDAKKLLMEECGGGDSNRVDVVQLDVTDEKSVNAAKAMVESKLGDGKLAGVISNAGILWGYPLPELIDVCATGVKRVLDAFVPLVEDDGRVIVVTSGLGPLMHSYSGKERQSALKWTPAVPGTMP